MSNNTREALAALMTEKELLAIVDQLIRDVAYNRPAAVAIGMAVGAAVEAEVRRRAAALATQPAQPSAHGEAVAWLVEWKAHGHGPQWWGFNHTPGKNATWCSDANNAIRFARKEDAERMRLHIIAVAGLTGMHNYEQSVSVTEHLWPIAATKEQQA